MTCAQMWGGVLGSLLLCVNATVILIYIQMRTLNLGELMFAHLVLWQIWDLNPGLSDTSLNNITEQGKRAGQGRGSWENWVLFLILALTHCVTLGTSPALSGPAHYLSEDMLILEPFSPQGG